MNNLLPNTKPQTINIENLRYLPGNPRSYRLDLGKGVLNLEGRQQLTSPGEAFKVLPIAFRCLQDGLFGQPIKKWCEVFFINQSGHIGVFMFHGFSVQNLSEAARDLFYQNRGLCEVQWTVKLERKINKQGKSYYMAFFDFQPLDDAALQQHQQLIREIEATYFHIYRSDTMDAKTLFAEHYSTHLEPTRAELEADKRTKAKLLEEFGPFKDQKAA